MIGYLHSCSPAAIVAPSDIDVGGSSLQVTYDVSAPKSCDSYGRSIANLHGRPEIAAISGTPLDKKRCNFI